MLTVRTQNDNDPFKMWLSSFSLIPLSLPMSLVFVDLETNNEKKNRQPTIWKMVCFALCRVLFAESSVSAQCSNAVVDVVNAIVLEHHFIIIIGIGDKSRWWNNFQFLKLEQPNEDQWITRSALFSAVRALHWKGNCFVNISRENRRKKNTEEECSTHWKYYCPLKLVHWVKSHSHRQQIPALSLYLRRIFLHFIMVRNLLLRLMV